MLKQLAGFHIGNRVASSSKTLLMRSNSSMTATKTSAELLTESSSSSSLTSSSTVAAAAANDGTTHYRITLRRSTIGLPEKPKRMVKMLGLRRRLHSVYRPQNSSTASAILAIKELVHVENVRRLDNAVVPKAKSTMLIDSNSSIPSNEEAIWINEKGEVVDWGGRKARKAPRGYTLIGNLINEHRHEEIIAKRHNDEMKEATSVKVSKPATISG